VAKHLADIFERYTIIEHHVCKEVASIVRIQPSDIAIDIPDFA
jgi:hypothetical protein